MSRAVKASSKATNTDQRAKVIRSMNLSDTDIRRKIAIKRVEKGQITTVTSNNHRLESAGLNALEELLRCWECTEKIVKPACVF